MISQCIFQLIEFTYEFFGNLWTSLYDLYDEKEPQLSIEFFKNAPQYNNAKIVNFVLAVPFEKNYTNEVYSLETQYSHTHRYI